MTSPKISIEEREVFCDLAVAIAATLECPECPRDLADALSGAVNPLEDLLAGSGSGYSIIAATLRGLVAINGKAESGHTETRAEAKAFAVAHSGAK